MRSLATETAQWGVTGRLTISERELEAITKSHRQHLATNAAFPSHEIAVERANVRRSGLRADCPRTMHRAWCSRRSACTLTASGRAASVRRSNEAWNDA